MSRKEPTLIPDDWMPSKALYAWAKQMHIDAKTLSQCRMDFVLWHTEKGVKRANFNLAFKNWLKKELEIDAAKMKPSSHSMWKGEPVENKADKAAALKNIMKLKGML